MKLLLDTCTFLWIVEGSNRLSMRAREVVLSIDNDAYLSAASAWEIATNHRLRRMQLSEPPDLYVPAQRSDHRIESLPIDEESAVHVARLPLLHRDPFDRILIAQAIVHGMTIVTPDSLIRQYPAKTLW